MLRCLASECKPSEQRSGREPATTIGLAGFGIAEQVGDPLRDALAGTGSGSTRCLRFAPVMLGRWSKRA